MSNTTHKPTTSQIRTDIIDAALPDIVFDGWSLSTIENAALKIGHNEITVKAAFPNGITDILDAFADLADQEMLEALGEQSPDDLRVRDRVKTALMARFIYLNDHKEAVKESMKFWLNPLRKPRAAKIIWRTADRIWNWAGDTSTDYNRYSKRTLLSGIIAPATLVWLNDHSEDIIKTSEFIDARIANVMTLGKTLQKIKQK